MTPNVTRITIARPFAVRGDGDIHGLGQDVTLTIRARVVAVEDEVADVTTFGSEDKQFIATGVREFKVLPLSAKVEP